jgi:hypothetical protein
MVFKLKIIPRYGIEKYLRTNIDLSKTLILILKELEAQSCDRYYCGVWRKYQALKGDFWFVSFAEYNLGSQRIYVSAVGLGSCCLRRSLIQSDGRNFAGSCFDQLHDVYTGSFYLYLQTERRGEGRERQITVA